MSKRLLFTGVSTMRDHAGQHKLYFIADALGRRGVPVSVLVPDRDENRAFLADKPHVDSHFYMPGNVASDLRSKARMLARNEWSAVWVVGVGLRSLTLRGWWAPGVPIVKDFDEFPSMIESFGPMRRAYLRWIERRMIRQAEGFTCASAFLEATVRRHRPRLRQRVLRLPVAISADEHQVRPELVARLQTAAGGRSVLVYVGSLNRFYEDQIDEILRLASVLRRRGSHAIIRILGGGPDADYFKTKSVQADVASVVEWAGHVDRADLASHMDAAHVLIFPFPATPFNVSRCPTKAFHYAAANRPVVTNRTGEVAALFGEAALYYPEHDVEALADRCEEALRRSARTGPGRALHELTWDARAETLRAWLDVQGWLPLRAAPRVTAMAGTR
ncbi:glycosyltransferase family 4 protein [Horticoccus sp. 23ND18S-11]|uniref:glycosyltransferase family 4 protein n=1 Tax=Horticoccus sp. 23ND18S-11 TaxID=3391832 RepID=UPI0039C925CE